MKNREKKAAYKEIKEVAEKGQKNTFQAMRRHLEKYPVPDNDLMWLLTGNINAFQGIIDFIDKKLGDNK